MKKAISIILLLLAVWLWLAKENGVCVNHDHCSYNQVCWDNYKCENIDLWDATLITPQEADELIRDNQVGYIINWLYWIKRISIISIEDYQTIISNHPKDNISNSLNIWDHYVMKCYNNGCNLWGVMNKYNKEPVIWSFID